MSLGQFEGALVMFYAFRRRIEEGSKRTAGIVLDLGVPAVAWLAHSGAWGLRSPRSAEGYYHERDSCSFYHLLHSCSRAIARPIACAKSKPVVVLELVLGILVGPSGAGWVTSEGAIGFLGEFGLIFLFFQAGFEFDFNQGKIGTAPLRLGVVAWLASLGLTSVFIGLLYIVGLVRAPLLVGLVLRDTIMRS